MAEELKNEQLNEEELELVNGGGTGKPVKNYTRPELRTESDRRH